jgi:dCMP deaminase
LDINMRDMMKLAEELSGRSNCARKAVGAVVARNGKVLAEGWNGVDRKFTTCKDAGCPRCITGGDVGVGYDLCICIHAEQRAIATAALRGISVDGATAFLTLRPCFGCLVLMRQAGIRQVFFKATWAYRGEVEGVYERLASEFDTFEVYGSR